VDREALIGTVGRIPLFRGPTGRRLLRTVYRRWQRGRRRVFERLGSDRYSRPAAWEIDRRLEQFLPEAGGVFLEAGAHDGFTESNTYYLERFKGWSGVLVEPIPALYRECVMERPRSQVFNCALVAADRPGQEVTMLYGGTQSVVSGAWGEALREGAAPVSQRSWSAWGCRRGWEEPYEVSVPARTLTSVLEEAGLSRIDFFSLDVEGYEADVIRGLDLDRYAPRFVLIEMYDEFGASPEEVQGALGSRYEPAARLSPVDVLYVRRD
jgi:FkbM family methyltransferase